MKWQCAISSFILAPPFVRPNTYLFLTLSIKILALCCPPPIVSMQGEMPFGEYTLPYCGLLNLLPWMRLAIWITLSIYHYYCLFSESSEDVARRYFVIVRGKTTTNAVCANRIRWGGVITLLGLITPGLARSVLHTPLTRFMAICFAWVIEEVLVSEICSRGHGGHTIFVNCIVISVYPHYPTPYKLAPMLADYRFNMFAFCYHWLQELPDKPTRGLVRDNSKSLLSQMLCSSAWGKGRLLCLSLSVSSITSIPKWGIWLALRISFHPTLW